VSEPSLRGWFVAVAALNIGISAFYRHRARRMAPPIPRSAESGGIRAVRAALAVPMLAGVVAYAVDPAWMEWSRFPLPFAVRVVGIVLGLASAALVVWVLRSLGANVSETALTRAGQTLVTVGPYRFVRHPLYSVGFLFLVSLAVIAANAFLAAMAVAGLATIRAVIVPREEAALIDRFGERYRDYRRRTGAVFPTLRRGER
jgi:protein-S-isoprenylcysteine O-methyltransferase